MCSISLLQEPAERATQEGQLAPRLSETWLALQSSCPRGTGRSGPRRACRHPQEAVFKC